MKSNTEKPTIGSLFSGIGGIDLGFKQAGFDVAWANDNDRDACVTYRENFSGTELFECSVTEINAERLSHVEVLTAGFPCQPFSVCGNQQGFRDKRGNLFFEIMRIADVLRPSVIFLENVANLTEHDRGRTFNIIHNELADRDYFIRYMIADACDYGIPQHRTRTYIVAFRSYEACSDFEFPSKVELDERIFDVIDKTSPAGNEYYLAPDSEQYRRLDERIRDEEQIYRFADYGIQSSENGIAFTLKANMGTWHNRVPYIRDNFGIRRITPNECLALQGFPKEFVFRGIPQKSAYKQCGNTVVVPLIRRLAENIKKVVKASEIRG